MAKRTLRKGDTILIGGDYAYEHCYEDIVGKRGIVRDVKGGDHIRVYVNIKDDDSDKMRTWFIRMPDAHFVGSTNDNYRHLLSHDY